MLPPLCKLLLSTLALLVISSAFLQAGAAPIDPWVFARAGLDHYYNLEYDEAIADLRRAIELDPHNAFFYNYLASTYLFKQLYAAEYLDAGLFSATNEFLRAKKIEPDPALIQPLREALRRAREISEQRLRQNPNDVEALYTLGGAYGIEANYEFNVNKKYFAALQDGNKAKHYHDRAFKLDPSYHDANLVRGLYSYVVGSIPPWIKWLAFLGGYRGSKEGGIELLQDAMVRGRNATSDAAILLAVIYYREKKYSYMRLILTKLQEFYPRNHLLPLQIGLTYMREGNQQMALEIYERVASQAESGKKFKGLQRDKLFYQVGMMLEREAELARALVYYHKIAGSSGAQGLVKAYAYLRMGEIYAGQERPDKARAMYEAAAQMPYAEPRQQARARLKALGAP